MPEVFKIFVPYIKLFSVRAYVNSLDGLSQFNVEKWKWLQMYKSCTPSSWVGIHFVIACTLGTRYYSWGGMFRGMTERRDILTPWLGGFPRKGPLMRGWNCFFVDSLTKHSSCRWFLMPWRSWISSETQACILTFMVHFIDHILTHTYLIAWVFFNSFS